MKPGEAGGEPTMPTPAPSPWESRARTGSPAYSPSPGRIDPLPELRWGSGGVTQESTLIDLPLLVFYFSDPGPWTLK